MRSRRLEVEAIGAAPGAKSWSSWTGNRADVEEIGGP